MERLEEVAEGLDCETECFACDFSSPIPSPLLSALSALPLDVLILNAGVSQRSTFLETPMSTFRSVFEVNLFSNADLIHALSPSMKTRCSSSSSSSSSRPQIVYVSSVQASLPLPSRSAYSASKAASSSLCASLRAEVSGWCDVCLVEPGYVDTDLSKNAVTGLGRHGVKDPTTSSGVDPGDLAEAIVRGVDEGRTVVTWGQGTKVGAAKALAYFWRGGMERVMRRRHEKAVRVRVN